MKCFVPNYSCLQKTRGLQPPEPRSLCPQLNLLNPLPPNKIPGYATVRVKVSVIDPSYAAKRKNG